MIARTPEDFDAPAAFRAALRRHIAPAGPLEHGRVWEAREVEPARSRVLRGMGWRTRIAIFVVAVFLASGVVAVIAACGGI